MTTIAKINKNLKSLNIDAEMHAGKGYVYFAGPAVQNWKTTSVPGIPNVKILTNEEGYKLFTEMNELNAY